MITMQSVQSSSIAFIGYDRDAKTLRVEFNSGAVYDYADVPENIWEQFREVASKGSFFLLQIKPNYVGMCVKVRTPKENPSEETSKKKTAKAKPPKRAKPIA